METRGATGVYDKANDSYTLYACSQSADALRGQARLIMGVPNEKLRVITEDVGGAFGMKTTVYPEYLALLVAAANSAGRCIGSRRVRRLSSATHRRAIPSPRPNLRSTKRANFWRCVCGTCATRAPM